MANSPLYSRSEILNSYVSVRRGSIAEIIFIILYCIYIYYIYILLYLYLL